MSLPFTPDEFFSVFAAYNRSLWPLALVLWLYAVAGAVVLRRARDGAGRFISALLVIQSGWAALAYHAMFFSTINPAAWLFSALFLGQGAAFLWFGVVGHQLRFSSAGSPRHAAAWTLIVYALLYPLIVQLEGHGLPGAPTFGVPCPTTLLTIGFLFAADRPWPPVLAFVPVLWAVIAGSAAVALGVHADLMLWVAAVALTGDVVMTRLTRGPRVVGPRSEAS